MTDNSPTAPHKLNQDVPQDLETICLKCLEKSPHVRYHSARELAEELARFLNHEPIHARPASVVRKIETWVRRRPWAITATASLAVLVLVCIIYYQFQQNLLIQYQQSHPQYVRAAGESMDRLEIWAEFFCGIGLPLVMLGHLFYREKSLRLTNLRQFFDGTTELADPQPVSTTVRIFCGAVGLSVLTSGLFLAAKMIETYVWEGPVPMMHVLVLYSGTWVALWLLVRVGQDYRQAVYGQSSRQIAPEQHGQMRESLLDGDPVGALQIYRKAIPNVGRAEAGRFVDQLAVKVEAEDPQRYWANQPKLWEINWRGVGIWLAIDAFVVFAVSSMMGSFHPGRIAMGLFGGSLFGGGMIATSIATARFKKNMRRRLVIIGVTACVMLIPIYGPVIFLGETNTLHSPFGWLWIVSFLGGVFLVLSAFSNRR